MQRADVEELTGQIYMVPAFFILGRRRLGVNVFGCDIWCLVASGAIERLHLCGRSII